jgi:AraC-like DNA-binding protein
MPNLSPTVPISFVQNMLMGARRTLSPARVDDLLVKSGIAPSFLDGRSARITREQFVRLYEVVAMATGDEMLGLWSRPIRGGTLKYLGLSLLDAPSLLTAMYRFTRFWNLLLDDYALRLSRQDNVVTLALEPLIAEAVPIIFGHELMIKLSHGVASWLVGRELPIVSVGFGFSRPDHFVEYAQLFPGPVAFDQDYTSIRFEERVLRQRFHRTRAELLEFVRRAPDEWIFVTFDHDSTASRIRLYMADKVGIDLSLDATAAALFMSSRTLSRRLGAEHTSFQKIKNEMRRDLAIQQLVKTQNSVDEIALLIGFDNTPAFHRAFRTWTGSTPGTYRRQTAFRST